MSAAESPSPPVERPARFAHPVAPLPAVGAGLACLSLAVALLIGPGGTTVPSVVLGGAAAAVFGLELGRRGLQVARSVGGPFLALGGLAVAALAALLWLAASVHQEYLAVGGALTIAAGVLIGRTVRVLRSMAAASRTPWQALRGESRHDQARQLLATGAPGLLGVLLGAIGLRLVGAENTLVQSLTPTSAVAAILVVSVAAGVVVARHGRRPGTASATPLPDQVAAHLHDSVLQTLALIQRNASDPGRVAQLARQQERSLRDWLAGRDASHAATLAAAIRAAAAEVEDEIAGAAIDVVCVGDVPLGRREAMLVSATREAMRNAARHGSPRVRVFAEADRTGATVYVRDTGPGFAMNTIPDDRRGIRDAIVGRMEHVDGTANIASTDSGTEVELTLPTPSP